MSRRHRRYHRRRDPSIALPRGLGRRVRSGALIGATTVGAIALLVAQVSPTIQREGPAAISAPVEAARAIGAAASGDIALDGGTPTGAWDAVASSDEDSASLDGSVAAAAPNGSAPSSVRGNAAVGIGALPASPAAQPPRAAPAPTAAPATTSAASSPATPASSGTSSTGGSSGTTSGSSETSPAPAPLTIDTSGLPTPPPLPTITTPSSPLGSGGL